ncbi:MAG: hypothetical protein R3C03_07025 [Pirellulaceae bacterium]
MSTSRRSIRKLSSPQEVGIDAEFWPVAMAICIAGSLAAGAVLSTMHGAWLWTSLIGLPVLVAAAIIVLQRLPQGRVRRSLQLAVLASVCVHLLVLIFAASTSIFHSPDVSEMVQNTPRKPERVMLIQRRNQPKLWEQVEKKQPVETVQETERNETTTSENSESRELPIAEPQTSQSVSADLRRTEQTSNQAPKLSESRSEQRRADVNEMPLSGGAVATSARFREAANQTPKPLQPTESATTNERSVAAASNANRNSQKLWSPMLHHRLPLPVPHEPRRNRTLLSRWPITVMRDCEIEQPRSVRAARRWQQQMIQLPLARRHHSRWTRPVCQTAAMSRPDNSHVRRPLRTFLLPQVLRHPLLLNVHASNRRMQRYQNGLHNHRKLQEQKHRSHPPAIRLAR